MRKLIALIGLAVFFTLLAGQAAFAPPPPTPPPPGFPPKPPSVPPPPPPGAFFFIQPTDLGLVSGESGQVINRSLKIWLDGFDDSKSYTFEIIPVPPLELELPEDKTVK